MLVKLSQRNLHQLVAVITLALCPIAPALAQTAEQGANTDSHIEGDFNDVVQIPNQNNNQNRNINNIEFPDSYPLDNPIYTPPNLENDLGFNMSVGVNTLDAANLTIYLGLIYQPGRTKAHQIRMRKIERETELLQAQKQIVEAELQRLQQQIRSAEKQL